MGVAFKEPDSSSFAFIDNYNVVIPCKCVNDFQVLRNFLRVFQNNDSVLIRGLRHHRKGMSVTTSCKTPIYVKADSVLCLPGTHPLPGAAELPTGSTLAWCCASHRAGFMDMQPVQLHRATRLEGPHAQFNILMLPS